MISAIIMRHYKCYNNINFIPITNKISDKYSIFVGNNGVGKSAILEALDVLFNDREWNVNMYANKEDAYICVLLMINNSEIDNIKGLDKQLLDSISDYFWNIDSINDSSLKKIIGRDNVKDLVKHIDILRQKYKSNNKIILIGTKYNNNKEAYFSVFDKNLREYLETKCDFQKDNLEKRLVELKRNLFNNYNYIYIPVEQSLNEVLKLQAREMQSLLDKDLLEEIEKTLNKKLKTEENSSHSKTIIKHINDHLDSLTKNVNESLAKINPSYEYTNESRSKKSLTAKDVREKILEAYFPLRTLKKDKKSLVQLSSGEQRKALIDVAYSILTNKKIEESNNIILAIDEPETSMHISNCFDQFIRLEELAKDYKKQVLITTHWYGFLPIANLGYMHHLDKNNEGKVVIKSFELYRYLEEKRRYPDVVELKSMFDLATSILTFMRNNPDINWIICEGSDDKLYLECMLKNIKNIKILPVGGCGNVLKLFQLLYTPLSEKIEVKSTKSKILFLIDTDKKFLNVQKPYVFNRGIENIVYIRRLQIIDDKIKLVDPERAEEYDETEIEDALNPNIFYKSLSEVIDEFAPDNIKDIFNNFEFNPTAKTSKIRGDSGCISGKTPSYHRKKNILLNYVGLDDVKSKLVEKYIKNCNESSGDINHDLATEIRIIFDE